MNVRKKYKDIIVKKLYSLSDKCFDIVKTLKKELHSLKSPGSYFFIISVIALLIPLIILRILFKLDFFENISRWVIEKSSTDDKEVRAIAYMVFVFIVLLIFIVNYFTYHFICNRFFKNKTYILKEVYTTVIVINSILTGVFAFLSTFFTGIESPQVIIINVNKVMSLLFYPILVTSIYVFYKNYRIKREEKKELSRNESSKD